MSSDKQIFRLAHKTARDGAIKAVMHAPDGYYCEIKEPSRTLDQNAKFWPMLHDISRQVCWYGNWLTPDEWKDFFTATVKQLKVVPNMDKSGFVAVGCSSSKMGKKMFADMIEIMYAFGSDNDVRWSDPGVINTKMAELMME
jgi:hypothetical protein